MAGHLKFLWLLVTVLGAIGFANARQIRINRYTTEVSDAATDDDAAYIDAIDAIEIEAIVREIKLIPYPAAGYRPAKAFLLPNELASDLLDNESVVPEQQSLSTSTIADELEMTTTPTESYAIETTTTATAINENNGDDELVKAPYPAAGFRPKIPFNLPTANLLKDAVDQKMTKVENSTQVVDTTEFLDATQESATVTPLAEFTTPAAVETQAKTPYPPAGFKPKILFFLPNDDLFKDLDAPFRPEVSVLENDKKFEDATVAESTTEEVTSIDLELETTQESVTSTPLAEITTLATTEIEAKTPYPPSGYKPKIIFLLPRDTLFENQELDSTTVLPKKDAKAPYPAAGFRPAKAFLLPNEQLKQLKEEDENDKKMKMKDNSENPACGSSTNPLAPKPLEGEQTDPDSETIFNSPQTVVVPARLAAKEQSITRPTPQQA